MPMEHKGKPLEVRLKPEQVKPPMRVSFRNVKFGIKTYDILVGGERAGEVSVGHGVKLPEGKATVINDIFVRNEGEGIGGKVVEHFIRQAKEGGAKLFVIREILERKGMFRDKFSKDVDPLKFEAMLQKISESTPIKWELLSDGAHRHFVVRL